MKVNFNEIKNMAIVDMEYLLLAISVAYKYIEYPEDFTNEVAKLLEENNLISK